MSQVEMFPELAQPSLLEEAEGIMDRGELLDECSFLSSGLYKEAYLLPSGRGVIKVVHSRAGRHPHPPVYDIVKSFEFEWAFYLYAQENGHGYLFPKTWWAEDDRFGFYMIQEILTVDESAAYYESDIVTKEGDELGLTDLHSANVGKAPDGRWKILDWGFDPHIDEGPAADIMTRVESGQPIRPHAA